MDESKKKKSSGIEDSAVNAATSEIVNRYGSAVKEHLVSYSGIDNETGQVLTKSLKSISQEKVNENYKYQNLKQQAGFSAEVKETARSNAEKIINGEKSRTIRTDDLGNVNDQLYDHVEIDGAGNVISGSGSQMKFVGGTPEECLNKLASKKFEKYLDADTKIDVPKDYYDKIVSEADIKIKSLDKQIADQKEKGNYERAKQLEEKQSKYKKIKKNVRKSRETTKEAMFAREHPELSAAADVVKVSHQAGVESAKYGAVIGGSVSVITNLVSVVKGEKEIDEALTDIAGTTIKSTASGYGVGFAGSALKGVMQNSKSAMLKNLSHTNLPGTLVTVAISSTKTISKFIKGDIDGVECFEDLGQNGVEMISGAAFAAIGQIAIPIPVVGGIIGSMFGYALASASYSTLSSSLKEAKLAREHRLKVEKECEEQIKLIRQYRKEMEECISQYLIDGITIFHDAFDSLKSSLEIGDVDGFITGANTITAALGKEVQFNTLDEFESLMNGSIALKL